MTSKISIFIWILVGMAVSCAGPQPSRQDNREGLTVSKEMQEWSPPNGMWTREQVKNWFLRDILQERMAGIVIIRRPESSSSTTGSSLGVGFIIGRDGYILSSDGVIKADTKEVQVVLSDGGKYDGKIILRDETLGFTLIKVEGEKDFFALPLGDVTKLQTGSFCLAAGWKTGLVGIVSSVGRVIGEGPFDNFLQTSPIINNKNGGGPLLDLHGEVVGINHSLIKMSRGFASPIGPIRNRIRSLVSLPHKSIAGPVPDAVLLIQDAITNAIAIAEGSTVNIKLAGQGGRSLGSGVVVSPEGYILTNSHIVEKIEGEFVVVSPTTGAVQGKVIRTYPILDLALVKAEGEHEFEPISVGRYEELKRGEFLIAIGNPFGLGYVADIGTVRSIVHHPFFSGSLHDFLETDVPVHPGNSGGPMVNLSGELVGINIAVRSNSSHPSPGFAVSITREIVDRIIRGDEREM